RARIERAAEVVLRGDLLVRSTAFAGLPASARDSLAERVGRREVGAGEELMRHGDPGESCFVLAGGRAEVLRPAPDGRLRPMDVLGPGGIVGEAALMTRS